MAILICKSCGQSFKTYRLTDHGRKRKFCTWKCAMGAKWNTLDKRGEKNVSKRKEVREKMQMAKLGLYTNEKAYQWKGDDVGYGALHIWILKKWGKATKCNLCGQTKGKIHWANKDGKYIRSERDNWIQLCPPCHWRYDDELRKKFGKPLMSHFQ